MYEYKSKTKPLSLFTNVNIKKPITVKNIDKTHIKNR